MRSRGRATRLTGSFRYLRITPRAPRAALRPPSEGPASLEELFDPDRLKDTHSPGGWSPPGVATRALRGHEFDLSLTAAEREDLIAFLQAL